MGPRSHSKEQPIHTVRRRHVCPDGLQIGLHDFPENHFQWEHAQARLARPVKSVPGTAHADPWQPCARVVPHPIATFFDMAL